MINIKFIPVFVCLSSEGMPSIIVEYAAHQNLKGILVKCRLALQKAEKAVKLLSDMESLGHSQAESTLSNEGKEDSNKAALLFSPKAALADGVPLRNYALFPQAILESDIYRMASQVVAGLMHLEELKVSLVLVVCSGGC